MQLHGIEVAGPPRIDQIEVTVFGPGYGEGVLIHCGDGFWVTIDSCLQGGECVPVAYLRALGIPGEQLRLVVASHWHDDHVGGLDELLEFSPTARFASAVAMTKPEFSALADFYRGRPSDRVMGGTRVMSNVLERLRSEKERRKIPASHNKILFELGAHQLTHAKELTVRALSPSDEEVTSFIRRIADLQPKFKEAVRTLVSPSPNDVSVVIQIRLGNVSLLFGADLEEHGDARRGWSAILQDPPLHQSVIFKVPHHGADNGDHVGIWSDLLLPQPIAVLAPYGRGAKKRPSRADIDRLLTKTPAVFSTAPVERPRSNRRRPPAVEKTLKEFGPTIRRLPFGAIRLRSCDMNGTMWSVEMFGDASQAEYLYSKRAG